MCSADGPFPPDGRFVTPRLCREVCLLMAFGSALEQSYANYLSYSSCRAAPSCSCQRRVDYQLIVGCLKCVVGTPLDQSQLGKYADIAMNILVVASELSGSAARLPRAQPEVCVRTGQGSFWQARQRFVRSFRTPS